MMLPKKLYPHNSRITKRMLSLVRTTILWPEKEFDCCWLPQQHINFASTGSSRNQTLVYTVYQKIDNSSVNRHPGLVINLILNNLYCLYIA